MIPSAVETLADALRRRILDDELRTALECEAARLALERHHGTLPASVHAAVAALGRVCRSDAPPWSAVVDAHASVHRALVDAARSPRITAAHRLLASEMRLFLVQLRPEWTLERMARD